MPVVNSRLPSRWTGDEAASECEADQYRLRTDVSAHAQRRSSLYSDTTRDLRLGRTFIYKLYVEQRVDRIEEQ